MSRDPPRHLLSLASPSQVPNIPDLDLDDSDHDTAADENVFRDMSFEEILEDLNARFLVNLPREEMTLVRVYWQAEQAHWFYEDYLRPLNPSLPSYSQRNFTHLIIASSPLYSSIGDIDYDGIWVDYCDYKRMVPCCGGIMINEEGDKCLMVRGMKTNAGWCFPRGKINSEESEVSCAIREVEEETGFNLQGRIIPKDNIKTQINAQMVTMFIVGGVSEDTAFKTQTRNEIGGIAWVSLVDLPTWSGKKGPRVGKKPDRKFFNVTPFVMPLKRWMTERGLPHFPKKKPPPQPAKTPLRALQPYTFESPAASAVPPSAVPTQQDIANTALDNLFNRFINKQEEDLAGQPSISADNKAGLQRLFGNLDEVTWEGNASKEQEGSAKKAREEKSEDDALAKLLGGLSTTPAPTIPTLQPNPTEKQSKLLSLLNVPSAVPVESVPPPKLDPVKPHQASLLAVLSPGRKPQTPTSHVPKEPVRPIALPTSPRPVDRGEEDRKNRQRALLEGITAGIGVDMPLAGPSSETVPKPRMASETDKQDTLPSLGMLHGIAVPHNLTQQQPYISHSTQVPAPVKAERPPPPPYDLFPFPRSAQGMFESSAAILAGGPIPFNAATTSDQQRGLLNALYSARPPIPPQAQPSLNMIQPQIQQLASNQGHPPPQLPFQFISHPQSQPQPQSQYLVYRPKSGHIQPTNAYPNFHPAQQYAPPPQQSLQSTYRPQQLNNPGQSGMNGLYHPLPPHPHVAGPAHQRGGVGGYHQPIPRPANSNGGVLLGMLNDGRGGGR